ncbi:hypothetical protein [Burkholderia gladioli]|uniref:hypothetical protein n=1 Tax=Burkholderia gladioli TaxID=28095 RepID=UPI0011D24C2C|nr:hypothetical protein [Burkholderia gladioli]MBW5285124.1 hypothetical protein [Burkholderia gladioli]
MKFIYNGNLAGWVCATLIAAGVGISYWTFKCAPPSIWSVILALLGFLLMAIGGLSGRARLLKIKPFGSDYKKVRDSYKMNVSADADKPK